MSSPCAPKRIFLIRLKTTPFRFERVKHFVQCWKDDFCLCTSYLAADYIVTELKSPSRIIRNAKQVSYVHLIRLYLYVSIYKHVFTIVNMSSSAYELDTRQVTNTIIIGVLDIPTNTIYYDSLCLNKALDPDKYTINVSEARATDMPLPLKPLPRQVKWIQLADMHNKALEESGIPTTFRFTAASEKRRYYAHKRKDKTKNMYVLLVKDMIYFLVWHTWCHVQTEEGS